MHGDFHMEEFMHTEHGRRGGRVFWQLNLKDDEEMRHADAFLYDHMLGYLDEGTKHAG